MRRRGVLRAVLSNKVSGVVCLHGSVGVDAPSVGTGEEEEEAAAGVVGLVVVTAGGG